MTAVPSAIRSFAIKFAGVIPEISCDIDPSGRTDLLKIIDAAEVSGYVAIVGSMDEFKEDATLEVGPNSVVVKSLNDEVLLVVPIYMLMSVGLVIEEQLNIVPLRIGEVDESADIFDLAVVYTRNKEIAEQICTHLDSCFQQVFHEAMNAPDFAGGHRDDFAAIQSVSSSSVSPLVDHDPIVGINFPNVTEIRTHKHCPSTFSLSTSATTASSKNSLDLINEYLTMLSACLTHAELNKFAILLKRWRSKEMPVLEFAQKLMELYGQERKHLLARMRTLLRDVSREDLAALSSFLQAHGVTENAASSVSPLLTGELSLTTNGSSPMDNISACSGTWSSAGNRR
ncbi:hypothetical protein M3Y98_00210200 [Aphelenchoides besseyi]|nr:hypothetical protein M3Y98_00210200 [Aphelenchoides besseyi]KAI6200385.1 hypothetical protein M3Y96_00728100 [Aphelenchoides besseyi]